MSQHLLFNLNNKCNVGRNSKVDNMNMFFLYMYMYVYIIKNTHTFIIRVCICIFNFTLFRGHEITN